MTSLSGVKQAEIIETFKSTSRYLDDLLNIDNPYFEDMVNRIYPPELQLNKANTSDTEAPFLDLHLSVSNGFVSFKIYDKRDDFDFHIVNLPFLDADVPRSTSYGVYDPSSFFMNVFIALKGTHFWILFVFTAAGVVPCGGRKTSPRTSTIVQFIFYFWSFEISVNVLRNQK